MLFLVAYLFVSSFFFFLHCICFLVCFAFRSLSRICPEFVIRTPVPHVHYFSMWECFPCSPLWMFQILMLPLLLSFVVFIYIMISFVLGFFFLCSCKLCGYLNSCLYRSVVFRATCRRLLSASVFCAFPWLIFMAYWT